MAHQVLQEPKQRQPQELRRVSLQPEHAQVRLPEQKKPEDVPPLQEHRQQPEPHQAHPQDAPLAPRELSPEPQASPPPVQPLLALPSQVSQSQQEQQARQPPAAAQGASQPWPSLASPLPPPLPSQPGLENVSAQVRPCRDRASSSAFSFP